MDIVKAVADLDDALELHLARLLLLLDAFSDEDKGGAIEGLTKLAKLDFLLRYPVMLEKALQAKGRSSRDVHVEDYERWSVESQMVRYRFGPWDHRYREFLNILASKGLVIVRVEGRKVVISITHTGKEVADQLLHDDLFKTYGTRARLLKKNFDLTATHLMNFIYETFPEIVSLRSNTPIKL